MHTFGHSQRAERGILIALIPRVLELRHVELNSKDENEKMYLFSSGSGCRFSSQKTRFCANHDTPRRDKWKFVQHCGMRPKIALQKALLGDHVQGRYFVYQQEQRVAHGHLRKKSPLLQFTTISKDKKFGRGTHCTALREKNLWRTGLLCFCCMTLFLRE